MLMHETTVHIGGPGSVAVCQPGIGLKAKGDKWSILLILIYDTFLDVLASVVLVVRPLVLTPQAC
jgi:hypothetical protein